MANSLLDLGSNTTIFEFSPEWSILPVENRQIIVQAQIYPGTVHHISFPREPQRNLKFYLGDATTRLFAFLVFFADRLGRYKAFWLQDWAKRFIPVGIAEDLSYLDIESIPGLYLHGKERLLVVMKNGDRITRLIAGAAQSTVDGQAVTRLSLYSNLPAISIADISLCTLIFYGRLNQDAIEIKYLTDKAATVDLEFSELIQEYPELPGA